MPKQETRHGGEDKGREKDCDLCAWDNLAVVREREKKRKYEELAADLARYWEYQ